MCDCGPSTQEAITCGISGWMTGSLGSQGVEACILTHLVHEGRVPPVLTRLQNIDCEQSTGSPRDQCHPAAAPGRQGRNCRTRRQSGLGTVFWKRRCSSWRQVEGHTADRKGALRHDHSSHCSVLRMTGGKRRAAQGWLGSLSEGLGLGVLFWCCEDALSRLCREGHVQICDLGGPSGEGLAADDS